MATKLSERLRDGFAGYTRAEKAIANYLLSNIAQLPFATAASIAESVNVSQMTVSRFIRSLGYDGLAALKEEMRADLRTTPLLISDRMNRIRRQSAQGDDLWSNFELEVQCLLGVYELRGTPAWKRVVKRLAHSGQVHVAGFQTVSGIAADFAARLEYLRPDAHYLDGRNGTFSELFGAQGRDRCLVLFEMRRYTRLSHHLARKASEHGVPIVIICDKHCYWAHDYTEDVLAVTTDTELFWDSQAPFLSLSNLLFEDLVRQLGDKVVERTRTMRELQDSFDAFQD